MYLQSPSIPTAGASAGAFARALPRLRGRVDAEDSELARIAVIAADRKGMNTFMLLSIDW